MWIYSYMHSEFRGSGGGSADGFGDFRGGGGGVDATLPSQRS